jgi:hypothetical protein
VLLVTHIVESGKSLGSDNGKINIRKKENIDCHVRYGYLITCQEDRDEDHEIF